MSQTSQTGADLPFQQLAQHLPTPCWISDAEGVITWVNDAWLAYTGKGPAQLQRDGLASLHDPQILPEVRRRWEIARRQGEPVEMVFPLRGQDGTLRPFLTRCVPLPDAEGRITRWFGTNTDVSDKAEAEDRAKRSEASLRDNLTRLRLAAEAGGVGVWEWRIATGEMVYSPEARAICGFTADEPVTFAKAQAVTHPEDLPTTMAQAERALDPAVREKAPYRYRIVRPSGEIRWVEAAGEAVFEPGPEGEAATRYVGVLIDVTEQHETRAALEAQARSLEVLNETGAALAAELDLQKIVQMVTDAGVGITGAEFGAFFYNLVDEAGESYTLYTLSGVDRAHFEQFPMPRNTQVFAPTFDGVGVVRVDDITKDPRYGHNAPHHGMPKGHLPVCSYLAVPVTSRSGEVIGGLFFGHSEPARFTETAEELVRGVAGQASVAIDNARLYQAAQREIDQRRAAEARQLLLINELNHRVKNTLATVQSIVAQTSRTNRSPQEVRGAIEGRLLALSSAHDLLTRHSWAGADLDEVVQRAAAPFNPDGEARIRAAGPSVPLGSQQALAISMALHELATNAAKYGALSVAEGYVQLTWRAGADLELEWRECGGPKVVAPTQRGFGSRLLERGLAADLRGSVELQFPADGVRCMIRMPLISATPVEPLALSPSLS